MCYIFVNNAQNFLNMRKFPLFIFTLLVALVASAWDVDKKYEGLKILTINTAWHEDILPGYEARYVPQGVAFDGPCRSTVIRRLCKDSSRRAILYVHGFNDYFFQSEMGNRFVDSGYNFYAVDLRRYGRSKLEWQYPYNVRDMREYFADIDSALSCMRRDGNTDITLMGHSTGGLTVLFRGAVLGEGVGVDRIIADSPFITWNFSPVMRNFAIPLVQFASNFSKNSKVKQAHCDGYAYSLLKQYDGEWEYNTDWKMIYSPPVTFSWVASINKAQKELVKKRKNIKVPILVMQSSRKVDGCGYSPEFHTGDAVLNPFTIRDRALTLGNPETRMVCTIDSGMHNLILSDLSHREAAYDSIFNFLTLFGQ